MFETLRTLENIEYQISQKFLNNNHIMLNINT